MKQPPNDNTPKDTTTCGPIRTWVHNVPLGYEPLVDEKYYRTIKYLLDGYLQALHKAIPPIKKR